MMNLYISIGGGVGVYIHIYMHILHSGKEYIFAMMGYNVLHMSIRSILLIVLFV